MSRQKKKRSHGSPTRADGSFSDYEIRNRQRALDRSLQHLGLAYQAAESFISKCEALQWNCDELVRRRTEFRELAMLAQRAGEHLKEAVDFAVRAQPPEFTPAVQAPALARYAQALGRQLPARGTTKKPGSWSQGRHA